MFAGPNGSGKSTLRTVLPGKLLGVYVNPDEVEQSIRQHGFLDLAAFEVTATAEEILPFFANSPFNRREGYAEAAKRLAFDANRLDFTRARVNSYFASVASDFIRRKLLERKASFTLETVMSHPSKVELLAEAQRAGYRTYLYYIATDDPEINISRVRNRVKMGGHPVPEDLIAPRYGRSLDLLMDAIRNSNRAYIFDNSTADPRNRTWLAEITDGKELVLRANEAPAWFKRAVLDKIKSPPSAS